MQQDEPLQGVEQDGPPVFYGDLRVTSDRHKGSCLFWVRAKPDNHRVVRRCR